MGRRSRKQRRDPGCPRRRARPRGSHAGAPGRGRASRRAHASAMAPIPAGRALRADRSRPDRLGLFRADQDSGRVMLLCGWRSARSLASRPLCASISRLRVARAAARRAARRGGRRRAVLRPRAGSRSWIAAALVLASWRSSPSGAAARLLASDGDRREAHAAARAASRDRDLPRRRAHDRVLPRPHGPGRRARRAVRRRPAVAPRVVRRAGRAPGDARVVHAVPRAADRRGRGRLHPPLRCSSWRARRSRRPGAATCSARAWSVSTSSTAAPSARSTPRDPDGHIVEIATSGPGFPAGGPSA